VHLYPFVLGAEPVRPVDLAAFYAAIANEGLRPSPHVIDFIERNGAVVYRSDPKSGTRIASVDGAAFYQLKSMMQGVVARGTARAIADLSPYVAGKTGTSDDANDAWFVGFTNDVTVAVWIGYDNADNRRRTLGGGATGGGIAVPIFAPVIRAAWADIGGRAALAPPSAEARRHLSCTSIDLDSGEIREQRGRGITECFRVDNKGRIVDTRARLEAGESQEVRRERGNEQLTRRRMRSYAREGTQPATGPFGAWQYGAAQYGTTQYAAPYGGRQYGVRQPTAPQYGYGSGQLSGPSFGWGR
jgi:penicillin-binding protein 1A